MSAANPVARLSRRDFLAIAGPGAAGALVLGVHVAAGASADARATAAGSDSDNDGGNDGGNDAATGRAFSPNTWLSIAADGATTIWLVKAEMGQGVFTALPMLVAEELDADWSRVRVEQALFDPRISGFGTGGSSSVSSSWDSLRRAGAAAREMLVSAAAAGWNVPIPECRTEPGIVIHTPSGRRAAYGTLIDAASRLPVPAAPRLKSRSEFRLIGTRVARLDTPMKVDGSATFGIDVRPALANGQRLLFAVAARCPVYGGKLASFDAARAKAVAGVRHIVPLRDTAVAVVADTTWAALEGRRLLDLRWDEGPNRDMDSASLARFVDERSAREGVPDRNDGDVAQALKTSPRTITATYATPFVAHAPMEPLNCTAHVRADGCEVWGPFQSTGSVHGAAVRLTGLPPAAIAVHTTMLGGGFGRKASIDFAIEALELAKAISVPVQLLWSREDDIRHDQFRPHSRHVMTAGVDRDGRLVAWRHRMAVPSLREHWGGQSAKEEDILRGLDKWATGESGALPYRVPNFRVEYVSAPTAVPLGAWRSVYSSQTSFADECFVDEVAVALGKDPYRFRLELMGDAPSAPRAVLERAAKEAGWGQPLPAGRFRGIAVYKANGSHVAQVAEVSVDQEHRVRVHRVVCAVDCGIVVNPKIVEAQMEGGLLFGLSAALSGEITFERGRCRESNFHDSPLLRLPESPVVEVHILDSDRRPNGVGEPGVPPIAPAVANAVSAAIGRRIRELPLTPARIAKARASAAEPGLREI
jgi:isoquinoline 1-oxidoreductase beta subunit